MLRALLFQIKYEEEYEIVLKRLVKFPAQFVTSLFLYVWMNSWNFGCLDGLNYSSEPF